MRAEELCEVPDQFRNVFSALPDLLPVQGICSYYNIGDAHLGVWSYREAYPEVSRISNFLSFEPDIVSVRLDGKQLHLEPGQTVIPHGPDRELTVAEVLPAANRA